LADERTDALAPLTGAGACLAGRVDLASLAEIFVSLPLLVELALGDRRIAFEGRLDAFFGAFFRVDMADLLLKSSESGMR
jgi:hypothetical protein